jgi:hypothetical protein
MSLTNESNKQVFLPQAGQTSFQFTLKYFNDTDIKVEIKLANGDIVPASDFSFTVNAINNNRDLGADVDITISPDLAAGDTVTIFREVPFTQQYDLQPGSTINPTALNDAFDRVVAQNQQQNLNTQRTITFPVSDPTTTTYNVDTSTTNRANRALGFDSNGNITELNLSSTNTVAGNNNKGINLTDGVIEAKVDSVTTEFDSNGNIRIKDSGVSTNKLATSAVTTAKIASTTGTDTNIVTGTKGANGQLVGWDANGDAVDSGFNVTNNDSLGTSDTTIPTQGNVKAYVDSKSVLLRSLFIYQAVGDTTISSSGNTTCPLTQSFSDDSSMSVSANIITLTSGTYLVKADANIGMDNNNVSNFVQGAIVDTGNSDSVLIAGKLLHSYNDYSIDTTHDFSCIGKLTLSSTTTMALKFRTNSTGGTGSTIGKNGSITGLGTPIHATVYIEKIT